MIFEVWIQVDEITFPYDKLATSVPIFYSETCLELPPNGILLCLLELILVTHGHLDKIQKADIDSKSKLVPSVFIKTHYWINHR